LGEKVKVRGPDGIELEFPIDAGHAYVDVDRVGVYTIDVVGTEEETSQTIVANFFDESESDIAGITPPDEATGASAPQRFEIQGERRLWKWLSVFALFVLAVEWFFYHRKGF